MLRRSDTKRFIHAEVGRINLFDQNLLDAEQSRSLLVFTTTPVTDSEKLALLNVLGADTTRPVDREGVIPRATANRLGAIR